MKIKMEKTKKNILMIILSIALILMMIYIANNEYKNQAGTWFNIGSAAVFNIAYRNNFADLNTINGTMRVFSPDGCINYCKSIIQEATDGEI